MPKDFDNDLARSTFFLHHYRIQPFIPISTPSEVEGEKSISRADRYLASLDMGAGS